MKCQVVGSFLREFYIVKENEKKETLISVILRIKFANTLSLRELSEQLRLIKI